MEEKDAEIIEGVVQGVTFHNPDNGFTVLQISCGGELITAVGSMPLPSEGITIAMQGKWVFNSKFGRQFAAEAVEEKLPVEVDDIYRALCGGIVKGIGPKTAARIVEKFGSDSFDVIESRPEKLAEIKGITLDKAKQISENYKQIFGLREVIIKLSKLGISNAEALNIYKEFGNMAVTLIQNNPYILCESNIGFGFERADELAESMEEIGNKDMSRERSLAGMCHILRHNSYNGHTCIPREKLLDISADYLEAVRDDLDIMLDDFTEQSKLVARSFDNTEYIFLPRFYIAERYIATRLCYLAEGHTGLGGFNVKELEAVEKRCNIKYDKVQTEAVRLAAECGTLVLTGGPGTGKTTTLNAIIEILESRGDKILLAAPTGRAAKRMQEVCGREAKTLHRLLEVSFAENGRQVFGKNDKNPLECDCLIIDEMSMVDTLLFKSVMEALPATSKLIMVGDSDQLPSIGAGALLHDIKACGRFPVVELSTIFRQAQKSLIVTNAHRIVAGEMPLLDVKDNDFFFLPRKTPGGCASTVIELYLKRLPKSYGYDPAEDIQILCPSRKGVLGSDNLNRLIQQAVNPSSEEKREIQMSGYILREGDKVMQVKNDYDIQYVSDDGEKGSGVYNGDIGRVEELDFSKQIFKVRFDDRVAYYTFENIKNLEPAYAITIHKSQGSEYECVIIPLFDPPKPLCYRNLLYTAVTRAKSKLILVGKKETAEAMTQNNKSSLRYTALAKMMM